MYGVPLQRHACVAGTGIATDSGRGSAPDYIPTQSVGMRTTGVSMFKVTPNGPDRLDIALSGKLDTDAMRMALDDLETHSKNIENGKMLYDVVDFHMPTFGAIRLEFSRLPVMFGLMKKFDRAAILTDKAWLKKVSELEGMLYPGVEIKAFDRDQRADAEAWLSS